MKLPRFTLRELLPLVIIAAMVCGWWVDRGRLAVQIKIMETEQRLDALRGTEAMELHRAIQRDKQATPQ